MLFSLDMFYIITLCHLSWCTLCHPSGPSMKCMDILTIQLYYYSFHDITGWPHLLQAWWWQRPQSHISQMVDKSSNIYLIWTKNTLYSIFWFTSMQASSMILAQIRFTLNDVIHHVCTFILSMICIALCVSFWGYTCNTGKEKRIHGVHLQIIEYKFIDCMYLWLFLTYGEYPLDIKEYLYIHMTLGWKLKGTWIVECV